MKDLRSENKGSNKKSLSSKQKDLFMAINDKINRKKNIKKIMLYITFGLLIYIIILKPDLIAKFISNWLRLFLENWNL